MATGISSQPTKVLEISNKNGEALQPVCKRDKAGYNLVVSGGSDAEVRCTSNFLD